MKGAVLPIVVAIALSAAVIGFLCPTTNRKQNNASSSWNDENAQDLLVMTKNIQGFQISNEPWPFPMINNSARRRLTEDTWSKEQRNMQQEIADFFKSKGVSSAGQVSKLKKKTVVRKMDDLPPVSVTCTDPNSVTLPCPDEGLPKLCDKYNSEGKFSECFQKCKKSFCCTHNSKATSFGKSCTNEPNCRNYIPCYIVWWKLSDTVGPASFFRLPQTKNFKDFFDVDVDFIKEEFNSISEQEWRADFVGHYTDDDNDLDDKYFRWEPNWSIAQKRDGELETPILRKTY